MSNLKTILERNIELERQKLYKQQEHNSLKEQEQQGIFKQEVFCIQRLLEDQNPLYHNFYLMIEADESKDFEVFLYTLREIPQTKPVETEYYYRGHKVTKTTEQQENMGECITEMKAVWLPEQNQWAIIESSFQGGNITPVGNRSELIKAYFNTTVRDIAYRLESDANAMAAQ